MAEKASRRLLEECEFVIHLQKWWRSHADVDLFHKGPNERKHFFFEYFTTFETPGINHPSKWDGQSDTSSGYKPFLPEEYKDKVKAFLKKNPELKKSIEKCHILDNKLVKSSQVRIAVDGIPHLALNQIRKYKFENNTTTLDFPADNVLDNLRTNTESLNDWLNPPGTLQGQIDRANMAPETIIMLKQLRYCAQFVRVLLMFHNNLHTPNAEKIGNALLNDIALVTDLSATVTVKRPLRDLASAFVGTHAAQKYGRLLVGETEWVVQQFCRSRTLWLRIPELGYTPAEKYDFAKMLMRDYKYWVAMSLPKEALESKSFKVAYPTTFLTRNGLTSFRRGLENVGYLSYPVNADSVTAALRESAALYYRNILKAGLSQKINRDAFLRLEQKNRSATFEPPLQLATLRWEAVKATITAVWEHHDAAKRIKATTGMTLFVCETKPLRLPKGVAEVLAAVPLDPIVTKCKSDAAEFSWVPGSSPPQIYTEYQWIVPRTMTNQAVYNCYAKGKWPANEVVAGVRTTKHGFELEGIVLKLMSRAKAVRNAAYTDHVNNPDVHEFDKIPLPTYEDQHLIEQYVSEQHVSEQASAGIAGMTEALKEQEKSDAIAKAASTKQKKQLKAYQDGGEAVPDKRHMKALVTRLSNPMEARKGYAMASSDHNGTDEAELSFKKGDVIKLLLTPVTTFYKEKTWDYGGLLPDEKRKGWFPKDRVNYIDSGEE